MAAIEERIWTMSDDELDASPLGIVKLDRDGIIHSFNKAEQRFVNRRPADAIGFAYFRDVAPCTAVKDFQSRFNDFVQTPAARCETFGFLYPFAWGHRQVVITMVKRADEAYIYIITDISAVTD